MRAPRLIVAIDTALSSGERGATRGLRTQGREVDDDLAKTPIPLEYEPDFLSLFKG